MSIFLRFSLLSLMCLLTSLALGQTKIYRYQIEGTYPAQLPGLFQPRAITFTLRWDENQGKIQGVYSDNFSLLAPLFQEQLELPEKFFQVELPRRIQNVNNLSIQTTRQTINGEEIPVMIFMRDPVLQSVAETNIMVRTSVNEVTQTSQCDIGFGLLSGYCGLYKGQINKTSDTENFCDLPSYNFRLELSLDGKTNLYFYYSDNTIGIPTHALGGFNGAPTSTTINLANRNCGVLTGTNALANDCQDLNLSGKFDQVGEIRTFQGTYTIEEEQSHKKCSYELRLERDQAY